MPTSFLSLKVDFPTYPDFHRICSHFNMSVEFNSRSICSQIFPSPQMSAQKALKMSNALQLSTSALYGWRFAIPVSLLLILLHNPRTHGNILSANRDDWGIYDAKNPLVPLSLAMQAELDWLSPQVPLSAHFYYANERGQSMRFMLLLPKTQCQYTLKSCLIRTFLTVTTI